MATTPVKPQGSQEFFFRGYAVAAGGFLTSLGPATIPLDPGKATTHGESSLPLIGGVSHSFVENPELSSPAHISYNRCETFVEGRRDGDRTITTLRASVQNVRLTNSPSPTDNVPDVRSITFRASSFSIEAESISALTGGSSFKVQPAQPPDMALVITDPSGKDKILPIILEFDPHFLSLTSVEELDNAFLSNRGFFDHFVHGIQPVEKLAFGRSKIPKTREGFVISSFVRQIRVGDDVIAGNALVRKGFGRIRFGVAIASPNTRRFTMAHIMMGSDAAGDVDFCAVEDTGIWG
jgi:hypothetical protein